MLINDQPAPLLFVSDGQINFVFPFGLEPESRVWVKVERDGIPSNVFSIPVVATAPTVFVVVLNQDGVVNSAENPASPGSVVSLWATGVGEFSPALGDGEVVGVAGPYPRIAAEVRVDIYQTEGDVPAQALYSGAAPGLVAGIAQINFRSPEGSFYPQSPVSLRIGQVETRIPMFLGP